MSNLLQELSEPRAVGFGLVDGGHVAAAPQQRKLRAGDQVDGFTHQIGRGGAIL